ncbi:MAG: hypothetical protein J5888_02385 [Bacteroidaceae bacterium]|nr:hypothetical protein [Bacteroidaceae bacterium]
MTEKKKYERPSIEVVELQQQAQLLVGSGGVNPNAPYTPGGDPFNP